MPNIDLQQLYEQLNRHYFRGRLKLTISWFGNADRAVRSYRTLGTYHPGTSHIQIHRILDQPQIPRYFLEYVIYHEMVHHVCPPYRGRAGRRQVHHAEYRRREQQFFPYQMAKAWEKKHLKELLAARRSSGEGLGEVIDGWA